MKYLNENEYTTVSDLGLMTCLDYLGFPIEAIDKTQTSRVQFLFKRSRELEQVKDDYWQRNISVEPMAFLACLKDVKSRIYNDHEIN